MAYGSVNFIRQITSLIRSTRSLAKLDRQPGRPGSEEARDSAPSRIERSRRFPVPQPLWYRPHGGLDWIQSRVQNVSRSGVLFQVQGHLKPNTLVELMLTLPVEVTGEKAVGVVCRAKVVRTVLSGLSPLLAVRMIHCRLGNS